ncbi:MAG: hypothetical protein RBR50_07930 [Candidatus Izemoplasmatales bacterium]|nr:hypothetical protein [Candidatus Izemoplasmatales bacterium]
MVWWKKLIYPFVWLAVMAIIGILKLFSWLEREFNELLYNWQPAPMRWEIKGIQKNRMFLEEVGNEQKLG